MYTKHLLKLKLAYKIDLFLNFDYDIGIENTIHNKTAIIVNLILLHLKDLRYDLNLTINSWANLFGMKNYHSFVLTSLKQFINTSF